MRKTPHMYQLPTENCSIFQVPKVLLPHNVNASEPVLVSIGRYHHGKENLQAMEALKLRYLYGLINQSGRTVQKIITLEKIVSRVMYFALHTEKYYEKPLMIQNDKFVEMMVIDGCFIANILFKFVGLVATNRIVNIPCILDNIRHNLILIQNQIPWFVLEPLYIQLIPRGEFRLLRCDLINHSLSFLYHTLPVKLNLPEFTIRTFQAEPNHFLDLLYSTIVYSTLVDGYTFKVSENKDDADGTDENPLPEAWEPVHCVKDLSRVGIKFQKGSESNILSVEFSDGIVKIPPLFVNKHTECLFRNLVALEQIRYDYEYKIGSYILLSDGLMKTSSDVHLLCEIEIIEEVKMYQIYLKISDEMSVSTASSMLGCVRI